MAKRTTASREGKSRLPYRMVTWCLAFGPMACLADDVPGGGAGTGASSGRASATTLPIPRVVGRLTSRDLGLVINISDPYSVEVGEFYIAARKLRPEQVLRIDVPVKPNLSPEEFARLKDAVEANFGSGIQAVAMAWRQPFAVSCNAITGALSLGFDPGVCVDAGSHCAPTRPSRYFNSASIRPHSGLGLRPSMLIAAKDVASAKALIERGVASDTSLALRGAGTTHAYFNATQDRARSARAPLFPKPGFVRGSAVMIHVEKKPVLEDIDRVIVYQTGATHVDKLDTIRWVPGALADHLTSFGGRLDGSAGQMSVLEWISSGATASYGTVSEPCSHPQKFPHPQVLLANYLQGSTAIEAYWKSVAWPLQGLFIGEPLAAPFAKR
jgi:uncharacterized protein (TIGR03790 family)